MEEHVTVTEVEQEVIITNDNLPFPLSQWPQ